MDVKNASSCSQCPLNMCPSRDCCRPSYPCGPPQVKPTVAQESQNGHHKDNVRYPHVQEVNRLLNCTGPPVLWRFSVPNFWWTKSTHIAISSLTKKHTNLSIRLPPFNQAGQGHSRNGNTKAKNRVQHTALWCLLDVTLERHESSSENQNW